ncbi:MAG: hypothetical protein P8L44_05150 [Opitutales bacterium]|nr:hypothetical protein [Opitutales bacterium]
MKGKLNVVFWALFLGGVILSGDDPEEEIGVGAGEWSASTGLGYKENVLFSEILPVDSAFNYFSMEGVVQKDFVESGAEWVSIFLLDNRNYWQVDDLPDETFGMFLSEFGRHMTIDGRLAASFRYVYLNQAFDASFDILDEKRIVLTAQEPGLSLEWASFLWQLKYTATIGASRMFFADSKDDYETLDWEVEIDYLIGDRVRFFLAPNGFVRDYTDRVARDLDGYRLSDTILGTDQRGVEGGFEQSFRVMGLEAELELEVDFSTRRDRHTGYYDRDRLKYGFDWSLAGKKWNFGLDVSYADSEYLTQISEDGELRSSKEWVWGFEMARDIGKKWNVFLRADVEKAHSNETFFSYESNSVLLGIRYR